MRYFTVSAKGRKGYNFNEMAYRYELAIDMFGKTEEFIIHADNRQLAIESGKVIVSSITFESTTKDVQTEVNKQNGLQQLKVAYRMLDTHEDKEKVYNYIKRLKAHFNIVDEQPEQTEGEQAEEQQTQVIEEEQEQPAQEENNNVNNEITVQSEFSNPSYTAFNRSFPTYNEAYQYCIESDFDPSYITCEEPIKASHAHQMDLQLFAASPASEVIQEPVKPFKKPFALYSNGTFKAGIGKHLELVYTVETTALDCEVNIHYSNIQKHERTTIQDAIELFNVFQLHGYHNLQIWTEVRYKGETIIENGSEGQLEFMINDSRLKNAMKTIKENEELKKQIEQYKSFLTHYKASETFKKYIVPN